MLELYQMHVERGGIQRSTWHKQPFEVSIGNGFRSLDHTHHKSVQIRALLDHIYQMLVHILLLFHRRVKLRLSKLFHQPIPYHTCKKTVF